VNLSMLAGRADIKKGLAIILIAAEEDDLCAGFGGLGASISLHTGKERSSEL